MINTDRENRKGDPNEKEIFKEMGRICFINISIYVNINNWWRK